MKKVKEEDNIPSLFEKGEQITNEHFNGKVYIKEIFGFDKPMLMDNVTFEPGCRNNWHGASKDSYFSHIAIEDPSKGAPEWFEKVSDEECNKLD